MQKPALFSTIPLVNGALRLSGQSKVHELVETRGRRSWTANGFWGHHPVYRILPA